MSILKVNHMSTYYSTRAGENQALEDFSIELQRGEMLGLIGESGCGKSTAGYSILNEIQYPGKIVSGSVELDGVDILKLSPEEHRKVLWKDIAMIPQSAMNALNPVYRIGPQIVEAIRLHYPEMSKADAEAKARGLLRQVGMDEKWFNAYPHKLSGGMKQRAIIAMALSCDPKLIISDESTTGLDVLIQAQILQLLKQLQKQRQLTIVIISHDLHMVMSICDRIGVMYAGRLVELGTTEAIQTCQYHPYAKALFRSKIDIDNFDSTVESIDGVVPKLINPPEYCRFYNRCTCCDQECLQPSPPMTEVEPGHFVACYKKGVR